MILKDVKPIRGYLLIEPKEAEQKSESGLVIPDTIQGDRPQTGTVLKVGGDLITEQGAIIPTPVKAGTKVIFKKWGGNEVKIEDKEYFFVRFDDIIGIC